MRSDVGLGTTPVVRSVVSDGAQRRLAVACRNAHAWVGEALCLPCVRALPRRNGFAVAIRMWRAWLHARSRGGEVSRGESVSVRLLPCRRSEERRVGKEWGRT